MKVPRFLATLIDPGRAVPPRPGAIDYAVERAPLVVLRLEERHVLTGGLLSPTFDAIGLSPGLTDDGTPAIGPFSVPPLVTTPSNQITVEGSPLLFSAGNGRLIRINDPDIGLAPLSVSIAALEAIGGILPNITLASTSGLTSISGNGSNIVQLEGTLSAINAALGQLTFYSVDDGDFTITVTADDPSTGESGSGTFGIAVSNANPQIQLQADSTLFEGSQANIGVHVSDAGALDQPHYSWAVSFGQDQVAAGVDGPIEFIAFADGRYRVTVTATDKDGGTSIVQQDFDAQNVTPGAVLSGATRDGEFFLTIDLKDPGNDLLDVEVFWSNASAEPDRIRSFPGTVTLSHRYTPEELATNNVELRITVHVSDGEGFSRSSLVLGENSALETPRPHIEPLPRNPAPDREALPRLIPSGTLPELSSSDVGAGKSAGKQEVAAVHQFIIRLVGPDGAESGSYLLPANAMENLPAFLSALGVPDGHYRVYLISGDLERLVLDGYLRGGRIVDPSTESQPVNEQVVTAGMHGRPSRVAAPAPEESAVATVAIAESGTRSSMGGEDSPGASALLASSDHALVAAVNSNDQATQAALPIVCANPATDAASTAPFGLGNVCFIGAGMTVAAAAAAIRASQPRIDRPTADVRSFTKAARWARRMRGLISAR